VSFSPVRTAISQLVSQGWIIKTDNRRLMFNKDRIGCGEVKHESRPPTVSDYVEIIMNDLIVASLRGKAIYIREEETAAKYGLGRTVVRRIFSELAGKKLLKHFPYRGWELRPFTEEDLDAFSEMRELVEARALSLTHERLDRDVLRKILDGNQVSSDDTQVTVDDSLHAYVIEKSNNRYFQDFFEIHIPYFRIFFCLENSREIRVGVARQHRAILEPLLAGKWRDARRALLRHLRYSHPVLRDVIATLHSSDTGEAEEKIRSQLQIQTIASASGQRGAELSASDRQEAQVSISGQEEAEF
jgi:DNA-binding GntR family transcriptional regulator